MPVKIYKNFFDIVILPSKEVSDYSISLSKQLYKYGSKWVLGKKSFLPHISLYHIPVKGKEFDKFVIALEKAVKGFEVGELRIEELQQYAIKLIFAITLAMSKPEWFKKLSQTIIETTLSYFDWDYGVEKLWRPDRWPESMQNNFKKYGTPAVGIHFSPHITLAMFKNEKDMKQAFNKLKLKKYSFQPQGIHICELGQGFSCQKIIKEIHF